MAIAIGIMAVVFSVLPGNLAAQVTLYEHTQFKGTQETFTGDDPDLGDNRIGNDAVSSIRVGKGCTATLFEHANFKGRSETISSDDSSLVDNTIGNDSATSIKVSCQAAERGAVLYEHTQFKGNREFVSGDDPDLGDNRIGNDAVSSIRVSKGCTATLFEHANFKGRSETISSDDPSLVDNTIGNDSVTSIKVSCQVVERGAVLYEHTQFKGNREFVSGDDPDLGDNRIGNDAVSSIRVSEGCSATLFEHANFKGRSETISSDDPSLVDNTIGNDSATSVQIRCGEGTAPPRSPALAQVFPLDVSWEVRDRSIALSEAATADRYLAIAAIAATTRIDIGIWKGVMPALHVGPDLEVEQPSVIPLLNMYQNDQRFSSLFDPQPTGPKSMICGPASLANILVFLKYSHDPPYSRILDDSLVENPKHDEFIRVLFSKCKTDRARGTHVIDLRDCAKQALQEGDYYDVGDVFIHGVHGDDGIPPGPASLRFAGSGVLLFGWYAPKDPDRDGVMDYVRAGGHFVALAGHDGLETDYMTNDMERRFTFYVSNPLVDYNQLHPANSVRYSKIVLEAVPGRDRARLPADFNQELHQAWQTRDLVGGALAVLEDLLVVRP